MEIQPSNPREHYYRPELDVLRFYAFFLVFISHETTYVGDFGLSDTRIGIIVFRFISAGRFGLSVFFVLSAFLLCELLLRERKATGSIQIGQFYLRRVARIWPLYFLAMALGVAFSLIAGSHAERNHSLSQIGWYCIFMAPWSIVHLGWPSIPISPLWSISVEERFYFLIPWILRAFRRGTLIALALVLFIVANAWIYRLGILGATRDIIWVNSLAQSQCFAAGVLISLLLGGRIPKYPIWVRLSMLLCSLICFYGASFSFGHREAVIGYSNKLLLVSGYLLPTLGASLALLALLGFRANLLPDNLIYLGRISYGLYAFHLFAGEVVIRLFPQSGNHVLAFTALRGVFVFVITVEAAALSYQYFESPFLRMRKRHAIVASQPDY